MVSKQYFIQMTQSQLLYIPIVPRVGLSGFIGIKKTDKKPTGIVGHWGLGYLEPTQSIREQIEPDRRFGRLTTGSLLEYTTTIVALLQELYVRHVYTRSAQVQFLWDFIPLLYQLEVWPPLHILLPFILQTRELTFLQAKASCCGLQ